MFGFDLMADIGFPAVGDNRPLRGFATHGEANTPSGARAESRADTNNKKTKGKSDEYGWVVNRRRVAVCKVKEKGRGKENFPLAPLKRKGEGKRKKRAATSARQSSRGRI